MFVLESVLASMYHLPLLQLLDFEYDILCEQFHSRLVVLAGFQIFVFFLSIEWREFRAHEKLLVEIL